MMKRLLLFVAACLACSNPAKEYTGLPRIVGQEVVPEAGQVVRFKFTFTRPAKAVLHIRPYQEINTKEWSILTQVDDKEEVQHVFQREGLPSSTLWEYRIEMQDRTGRVMDDWVGTFTTRPTIALVSLHPNGEGVAFGEYGKVNFAYVASEHLDSGRLICRRRENQMVDGEVPLGTPALSNGFMIVTFPVAYFWEDCKLEALTLREKTSIVSNTVSVYAAPKRTPWRRRSRGR